MTNINFTAKLCTALLLCSLLVSPFAVSQQTAEQFIPIGKSPGISDKYSYIGVIVAVDRDANTIDVRSNRGTKTLQVTEKTRLWLDRSEAKLTNPQANYSDCKVGVTVEVMYSRDDNGVADWIKIEAT